MDDDGTGVPSDHDGVIALPVTDTYVRPPAVVRKTVRPMPESLMTKFGRLLSDESWSCLSTELSSLGVM